MLRLNISSQLLHDIVQENRTDLHVAECRRININVTEFMVTWNNDTYRCLGRPPEFDVNYATKVVVLSVMAVVSFVGNVWTVYSIYNSRYSRRNRQQNAVYTLIMHLCVADLFVTVFCLAGEAVWNYTVGWVFSNLGCKLFKYFQMFSLYLSTFVLVLIGIDRFLAVKYPMKSLSTTKRCNRLIACAWTLSIILSIPQLFVFEKLKGPFFKEFYQCVSFNSYFKVRWLEQFYPTFTMVVMFILPLIILISTYVSTVITISRSDQMFRAEATASVSKADVNRRRLIHRAKIKSFRISVIIVAAFIICWTPYYTLMTFVVFFEPDSNLIKELNNTIFIFGMSNSLVNPIIYGAFQLWRPKRKTGSYRDGSLQQTNTTRLCRESTLKEDSSSVLLDKETGNGHKPSLVSI